MVIDTNTREELSPQNFEKMSENSKQYTEHVVHNKTQHPRAVAITFEFGRHIDTYTKIPQHPKIPNPFLVKLKN